MNQIKILRKTLILTIVMATVLLLVACNKSSGVPYGNLSDDQIYLRLNEDISISKKELYNEFRMHSSSTLSSMIDEIFFAEEIQKIRTLASEGDEDLIDFIDETINSQVHAVSQNQKLEKEDLEKLMTESPDIWNRNIEKFVDSLYLSDNTLDIDSIRTTLQNGYENYYLNDALFKIFEIRAAQRNYAKQKLAEAVLDQDSDYYINEDAEVSYYKSNIKGRYDVEVLIVSFINLNEANAALHKASIKQDSRGLWYLIPDIRISDVDDPNYIDIEKTGEDGYAHVKTILNDLDIDYSDRESISLSDYQRYYNQYRISTDRTDGLSDISLTLDQVKAVFVDIYNMLNPAKQIEIVDDEIVGAGGTEFKTTYTYDDLTDIHSSLRSHVYTTLTAETIYDEEENEASRPYSGRVQTFGNRRYLVFKLDDKSATEEGILITDPEDDEREIFADTEEAKAQKAEVFAKLQESKLTSDYITNIVSEFYDDQTITIYDFIIRTFYEHDFGYNGKQTNKSGDVVAEFGTNKITVEQLYNRMEISYGINMALDLAVNKYLTTSPKYTVSSAENTSYRNQFNQIIEQFSANQFESSGFPATMGREKFLLLGLGATSNQDAINRTYVYPNLRDKFLDDLNAHYDFENYSIYEKFADLAKLQHDYYLSINTAHLLIYIDQNGDETPDDPAEYLESLTEVERNNTLAKLIELIDLIFDKVGNYKNMPEALTAIASDFNKTGRIQIGSIVPPIDQTLELTWAEYRQYGFNMKYESITSPITNTSNFPGTLDKVFYDRALEIHQILAEQADDDSKLPYLDLYDQRGLIDSDDINNIESSFGWHLILATTVTKPVSAEYSQDSDTSNQYVDENDPTISAYNEDQTYLLKNQVQFYLNGLKSDLGPNVPTSVQTAITTYLTPVITKYENGYMQRELMFKLLENAVFTDASATARLTVIRQINRNQFHDYRLNNAKYVELYGDWFSILEAEAK